MKTLKLKARCVKWFAKFYNANIVQGKLCSVVFEIPLVDVALVLKWKKKLKELVACIN